MARACRFLEYSFSVDDAGSIKFEELDAEKLNIKPGDAFLCFVDPNTREVTMRKYDPSKYEQVSYREC
jgi:bifunctional DNA-binding transcriptional regulator/antitoxin component of YhaV-PrlF toxin-antitoxin module